MRSPQRPQTSRSHCRRRTQFWTEVGKPLPIAFFDYEELSETATVDANVDIDSKLEKKKEVTPAEPAAGKRTRRAGGRKKVAAAEGAAAEGATAEGTEAKLAKSAAKDAGAKEEKAVKKGDK